MKPYMTKDDLEEVWEVLTDREKTVISMRFALEGGKPETFQAIGKRIGVVGQTVLNIQGKALRKLRSAHRDLIAFGRIQSLSKDNGVKLRPTPFKRWKTVKRVKKVKPEPPPPEQTDEVRLDWMEAEIRVGALWIDWNKERNWKIKFHGEEVYADNLRLLIDSAIARSAKKVPD